jgi:hypothetical protein
VITRFVDQTGTAIDPTEVVSATARSDSGAVVNISPTGATWLESTRVGYRSNTIYSQDVSYSWQTVIVAGTNVIDGGRQSFAPATTPEATVAGQFHDLTITGHDALLGTGIGEEAVLTLPDGTVRVAPLGTGHASTFDHLPRGTYQANIRAGSSIVASQQIRLSRTSTVDVPVISPVDIGILLGAVTLGAIALVLIGRRNVRRRLFTPFRPARGKAPAG